MTDIRKAEERVLKEARAWRVKYKHNLDGLVAGVFTEDACVPLRDAVDALDAARAAKPSEPQQFIDEQIRKGSDAIARGIEEAGEQKMREIALTVVDEVGAGKKVGEQIVKIQANVTDLFCKLDGVHASELRRRIEALESKSTPSLVTCSQCSWEGSIDQLGPHWERYHQGTPTTAQRAAGSPSYEKASANVAPTEEQQYAQTGRTKRSSIEAIGQVDGSTSIRRIVSPQDPGCNTAGTQSGSSAPSSAQEIDWTAPTNPGAQTFVGDFSTAKDLRPNIVKIEAPSPAQGETFHRLPSSVLDLARSIFKAGEPTPKPDGLGPVDSFHFALADELLAQHARAEGAEARGYERGVLTCIDHIPQWRHAAYKLRALLSPREGGKETEL